MGTNLGTTFSAIGDFLRQTGIPGALQYLANALTTVPGLVAMSMGALVFCIIMGVVFYSAQRREIEAYLQALSEAMDEQSQQMEKLRRTLADVMEVMVSLEASSRYRARTEPRTEQSVGATPPPGTGVSAALREELELLKAEMAAELTSGPAVE